MQLRENIITYDQFVFQAYTKSGDVMTNEYPTCREL